MTNHGPTKEEYDSLIYKLATLESALSQARRLLEALKKMSWCKRYWSGAAVMVLVVTFIVSSCAPSMDQERQQLLAPARKIVADSDAKLIEDVKQYKEQDEAWQAQHEKWKQKVSSFEATLSDKELLALADYQKAAAEKNEALRILTGRKYISLLADSGKIGAFMVLKREHEELMAKAKALDKKQAELNKEIKKSEDFWKSAQQLDREWEEWKQHRELVDAVRSRSINKPTHGSGTIMTPSGGMYFYNYNQY